ncbi:uncharacterized protein LOC135489827 [Lineus longissimus]|uniref:uncharacterized protein LOC135489827 n=1 Tax=Lineus longissimus TaxID=88925 RepID=UPI002B4F84DB
MSEAVVTSQHSKESEESEPKNETITLIIPQDLASADGIQVVTLPPGIGDLSNVRVQVGDAGFENHTGNEHTTCQIVHEVIEPLAGGDTNGINIEDGGSELQIVEKDNTGSSHVGKDGKKVSIAIQANDYEIERRSGRTPARMRVIPAKFRDYKNPDFIKEEPESDDDYEPSDEWEFKPLRGRGRPRVNPRGMKRENKKPGRPGRPRKYPKIEPLDFELLPVPAAEIASTSADVSLDMASIPTVVVDAAPESEGLAATDESSDVQPQVAALMNELTPKVSGEKSQSKAFVCKTCSKTFTLKGNLKAHEFIHLGLKPYRCDAAGCEQVFRTTEACRRHKLTHLGVKLFECVVCKVKFSTNQALKEHMSRHTDSRPHVCKFCQKRFRQLSCLSRHITTHSDEKPYPCDMCSKRFSQMAYLKSHKRSHTGERPFKCTHPGCEKCFAHQSDLIRHKIIHTGTKPFACDLCPARFNDPSSRRRHLKEHTGTKPYACQLCEESFRRAGQLKVHLSKQHMGVISVDAANRPVLQVQADASCLRFLLREDGGIESIPITEQVIDDGQVVHLEAGKDQTEDEQLEHVQSQLQQVLMQLRQQRNQFPNDSTEVDVHVVTVGPDGQVQERVDRVLSQTLESMGNASRSVTTGQDVTEQEMAVQIALEEMGVIQDDAIPVANSESLDTSMSQNNVQDIVNVSEIDTGPLSPSVLSTARIMQDIRNAPVQYEHTYTSVVQYSSPNHTVADNVEISEIQNAPVEQVPSGVDHSSDQDQNVQISSENAVRGVIHVPIEHFMSEEGTQKLPVSSSQEVVYHYEDYEVVREGEEPHVLEIQYTDESEATDQNPGSQLIDVKYVEEAKDEHKPSSSQILDSRPSTSQLPTVSVDLISESTKPQPPASSMDYVHKPDFSSQDYYNWLSSFVELCKVVPMPLDIDLFQKVSQVHKTLSDVLANPSGVLSNKDNYTTMMSISRDLGGIVNEHLTFVLKTFEKATVQK